MVFFTLKFVKYAQSFEKQLSNYIFHVITST